MMFGSLLFAGPLLFFPFGRPQRTRLAGSEQPAGRRFASAACGDVFDGAEQPSPRTGGFVEAQIFRIANEHAGRLMLSDVVVATTFALREAEALMDSLVDQVHVWMEVQEDGGVLYEFPELINRAARGLPDVPTNGGATALPAPARDAPTKAVGRRTC